MVRHQGPPKSAWTWPAKLAVAVAAWCACCAGSDYVTGHGWWALILGAMAVFNVAAAARQVRSTLRWQQAHQRQLERQGGPHA